MSISPTNSAQQLGRFLISFESNISSEQLLNYIDSTISNHAIDENMMCELERRQLDLLSFDKDVEPHLILFDDVDKLKRNIMLFIVESSHVSTNMSILILKYIYVKYTSSLLMTKPTDACLITLEELKNYINQRLDLD